MRIISLESKILSSIILLITGGTACGCDGPSSGDGTDSTIPAETNQAPTAVISATPTSGIVSLLVNVATSQSNDAKGVLYYLWDFGDGTDSQSPIASSTAGNYMLTLAVADREGEPACHHR